MTLEIATSPERNGGAECANLVVWFESVAQLVEHRPFKALVLGSSPSALTIASPKFIVLLLHQRTMFTLLIPLVVKMIGPTGHLPVA